MTYIEKLWEKYKHKTDKPEHFSNEIIYPHDFKIAIQEAMQEQRVVCAEDLMRIIYYRGKDNMPTNDIRDIILNAEVIDEN